ncbi:MAG: hypothetical protein AAF732_13060 [Pseudomonadota bacterium]
MKRLPSRPDIAQLKKQAKELFAAYRSGDTTATDRFRESLPAAAGRNHDEVFQLGLRLHDAQSCIAREYGFVSWVELKTYVETLRLKTIDPVALALTFARFVYAGDVAGGMNRGRPEMAARLLSDNPDLIGGDPWLACAVGDVALVRRQTEVDPAWVNQSGGPLNLPPLIAATHSSLLHLENYKHRIHEIVDLLLNAGADPNQTIGNRWPPASLEEPSDDNPISALYGAAGQNHDPELTRRLLNAGADPNDNESLYHALESLDCTRLLLEAGATVTGTNALYRALDFDDLPTFQLLVSRATGANELRDGKLLLWAIRRRRSPEHIQALLAAGVDKTVLTRDGASAHTQAVRYGLPDVAEVLLQAGLKSDTADSDLFVAACARGDTGTARNIKTSRPDFPDALSESQLRLLPELAAAGCDSAVRVMVELDWPIAVRGGDWSASALNHAVLRGDAELTRFLLAHGARWTEEHGYGDNVCGTLSWASINRPVEAGDWAACAQALIAHGMPPAERDPSDPAIVIVADQRRQFSEDVNAVLVGDID